MHPSDLSGPSKAYENAITVLIVKDVIGFSGMHYMHASDHSGPSRASGNVITV